MAGKRKAPAGVAPKRPRHPALVDPATMAVMIRALRNGATNKIAADAAGVDPTTFSKWMTAGAVETAPPELRRFYLESTRARASNATDLLQIIVDAALQDWRAAAWMLERLHGITKVLQLDVSGARADDPLARALTKALENAEKASSRSGVVS